MLVKASRPVRRSLSSLVSITAQGSKTGDTFSRGGRAAFNISDRSLLHLLLQSELSHPFKTPWGSEMKDSRWKNIQTVNYNRTRDIHHTPVVLYCVRRYPAFIMFSKKRKKWPSAATSHSVFRQNELPWSVELCPSLSVDRQTLWLEATSSLKYYFLPTGMWRCTVRCDFKKTTKWSSFMIYCLAVYFNVCSVLQALAKSSVFC